MLPQEEKEKIEGEIVEMIAEALQKNVITTEDTAKIADFVLTKIKNVNSHEELLGFLAELSHKWPLFQTILDIEKGEIEMQRDRQKLSEISEHLKNGDVDSAIQSASNISSTQNA